MISIFVELMRAEWKACEAPSFRFDQNKDELKQYELTGVIAHSDVIISQSSQLLIEKCD